MKNTGKSWERDKDKEKHIEGRYKKALNKIKK